MSRKKGTTTTTGRHRFENGRYKTLKDVHRDVQLTRQPERREQSLQLSYQYANFHQLVSHLKFQSCGLSSRARIRDLGSVPLPAGLKGAE